MLQFVYNMAAKVNTKRGILPGYFESLQQKESKERYLEKLKSIEGQDPYEISRKEWIDDVDCWPDVTYINVGMYLLLPIPHSDKVNWLSCIQNAILLSNVPNHSFYVYPDIGNSLCLLHFNTT